MVKFTTLLITALSVSASLVSAATQDSKCKNVGGFCQATSNKCSGSYLTGYCPSSGSSIKCCKPKQDTKCHNTGGSCKYTNTSCSGGSFLSNYCPSSGANVKCCKPTSHTTPAPPPSTGGSSYCKIAKTREALAAAAKWASKAQVIHYTQSVTPRWSGIHNKLCPKSGGHNPPYADCSSFVTWIYWSAFGDQTDKLNGQKWKGGNTDSLKAHGKRITKSQAKLADLVFYEGPAHVGIIVQLNPMKVVEIGSTEKPLLIKYNYRTPTQYRTYGYF
ncbi:hypothetical protein HDV00_005009 [Rhizophlyctis rosea]|nr:hypothetical protein HDV00_005009 [Rhizophlyctis rosea]